MNIKFRLPDETIAIVGKDIKGIHSDVESIRLPLESKRIISKTMSLVKQRFELFKDEIDKEEESENENYTLLDFNTTPFELKYVNYSERLSEKMKGCICKEDFEYLERDIKRGGSNQ